MLVIYKAILVKFKNCKLLTKKTLKKLDCSIRVNVFKYLTTNQNF